MRILVVKGTDPLSPELRKGLQKPTFEMDIVSCPQEAETMARGTRYDAIILDLMIVLAARAEGEAPPQDEGTLTRPADVENLVSRLMPLVLRTPATPRPAADGMVLRVHDLEINTAARSVKRAGVLLDLTNREFDVLELLARNKGQLVTHRAIRSTVWGDEQEMHSSIVGIYIRRVREKVDRGHPIELVLTRWGDGYMMRGDG
jgi:DNA-binding response OmpR family regulator